MHVSQESNFSVFHVSGQDNHVSVVTVHVHVDVE